MKKLPAGDAFSTARVWQLMKHFITLHRKSWEYTIYLILAGILMLYVLVFSLADPENIIRGTGDEEAGIQQWYLLLGCLLSSRLFIEIHKPSTSWQFLSLPTTSVEKFTAAWMIAVPFYTILAIGVGLVLMFINTGVGFVYFGELLEVQVSLTGLIKSFAIYLIWSSVFLWGAVYFKSLHFIKTTSLAVLVIFIVVASLALLLFEAISIPKVADSLINNTLLDVTFYGMAVSFTLLMLYLGYERLTKAEVRP
jgi:hypothetical protein